MKFAVIPYDKKVFAQDHELTAPSGSQYRIGENIVVEQIFDTFDAATAYQNSLATEQFSGTLFHIVSGNFAGETSTITVETVFPHTRYPSG